MREEQPSDEGQRGIGDQRIAAEQAGQDVPHHHRGDAIVIAGGEEDRVAGVGADVLGDAGLLLVAEVAAARRGGPGYKLRDA